MSTKKQTPREHWTNLLKEAVDAAYPVDSRKPPLVQTIMRSRQPQTLASAINTHLNNYAAIIGTAAEKVTTGKVEDWLKGTTLPKPAQYEALVAIFSPSQREETRDDWEASFKAAYTNAQIAAQAEKDCPAGAGATSRAPRPSSTTGSPDERTPPLNHHDGRALPEHRGRENYEELSRPYLQKINGDTKNAAEYLIT